jgi:O-antigen/teichoic acid export membrane protein
LALSLAALGDAGLTLWTQQQIVLRPNRMSKLVSTTTVVQLGAALTVVALTASLSLVSTFPPGTPKFLLLASPFAITQAFSLHYVLQAFERMRAVATTLIVAQVFSAASTILLVVFTHDAAWVAVNYWSGWVIGDLLVIFLLRRQHGLRAIAVSVGEVVSTFKSGLPLLSGIALFYYINQIDTVIVGALLDARTVGQYSAAFRLAIAAYLFVLVLARAANPEMVRRFAEGLERFESFVRTLLRMSARVTLAAAAIIIVEAPAFVSLIYGGQYARSADLLRIFVLLVPIGWHAYLVSQALVAAGERSLIMRAYGIAAIFTTLATPSAVLLFGVIGAATAVVATALLLAGVMTELARRHIGARLHGAPARELAYGVVPLVALLALNTVVPNASLATAITVWLVAVIGVEVGADLPTVGFLRSVRSVRAH